MIPAQYPNPFKGVAAQSFIDTNEDLLSLVDGGHDGENIPIQPLLVKARGVDTIFVIDVSVCPWFLPWFWENGALIRINGM